MGVGVGVTVLKCVDLIALECVGVIVWVGCLD